MQRLTEQVKRRQEDGATAVVFALVLMVLVGFVALGVDVTAAYARSQEVQNGADAAALAAAQECAKEDVTCVDRSQAGLVTSLAAANVRLQPGAIEAEDVYPHSNRVTVTVSAEHDNVFAGVFGVETFTVVREATAQWDSPQAGPAMLPMTISICSFINQTTGQPNLTEPVEVWMPSGNHSETCEIDGEDYPAGGFGWLDHQNCQVEVGVGGEVDGSTGASVDNCVKDLVRERVSGGEEATVLIPIFTHTNAKTGNNATYFIERFAAFRLLGMDYQTGNPKGHPKNGGNCIWSPPKPTNQWSDTCLRGTFVDWVEIGEDYSGGAPETEVSVIRLIDPAYEDAAP